MDCLTSVSPLCLSQTDRRRLVATRQWAHRQLTTLKRRRKYVPHEAVLDPHEAAVLQGLIDFEKATGRLLSLHNGSDERSQSL